MDITVIIFWIISTIAVVSALGVVFLKNIVHASFSLIITFLAMAAVYLSLQADFLGLVQVLVYAGAVSVLILFAIMLVQNTEKDNVTNKFGKLKLPGFLVSIALLGVITLMIRRNTFVISDEIPPESTVEPIAILMLTDFVVPFEAAAILLLVALVGGIVIGKGADDKK